MLMRRGVSSLLTGLRTSSWQNHARLFAAKAEDSAAAKGTKDKKNILVLGAGRSSSFLIDYLLNNADKENWTVRVGDADEKVAKKKIKNHPSGAAFRFDINDVKQREEEVKKSNLVVSLLPAFMHPLVATECVKYGANLVTASYASGVKDLDKQAKDAKVLLMMECGLDPGIDHMSAMEILDNIRKEGGQMKAFRSFTGGLVAPESDNNPWGYKFSWNPRNVVLAGQGPAKYIHNGEYKYIPYQRLFERTELFDIPEHGAFEGYANRDSLSYRSEYGLENCPTVLRGTLRKPGYCSAWNVFVQLGMTDDTYEMENVKGMTYRDFLNSFLEYRPNDSVELKLAYNMGLRVDSPEISKIEWLGLFDHNQKIKLKSGTPAQVLQHILEQKWKLNEGDKDMIVMCHQFVYTTKEGETKETKSSLVVKGDGTDTGTAMAKTVGLPLAIATKLVAQGNLKALAGVQIPTRPDIYSPILRELEQDYGVHFNHHTETIGSPAKAAAKKSIGKKKKIVDEA